MYVLTNIAHAVCFGHVVSSTRSYQFKLFDGSIKIKYTNVIIK